MGTGASGTLSRRGLLAGGARAAGGLALAATVPAWLDLSLPEVAARTGSDGRGDAAYWSLADAVASRVDQTWDAGWRIYQPPGEQAVTVHQAAMLLVHAAAARTGHRGPARRDERAAALVRTLTTAPCWLERPPRGGRGGQLHARGWGMYAGPRPRIAQTMHVSVGPRVAEALTMAWQARSELGLEPGAVAAIEDRVVRSARGPFWRYPAIRLNQMNWPAELYACAAVVGDGGDLLRGGYRRHLERFCRGARRAENRTGSPNLAPSYRFHYQPTLPAQAPHNLDSPEYAHIVSTALGFYEQALTAGMRPLRAADERLLGAWITRLLCGSWTHAGYLNWDTGLGRARWHSGRYWAHAQRALSDIALSPRFHQRPEFAAWATHLFGRGVALYARMLEDGGSILPVDMRHGLKLNVRDRGDDIGVPGTGPGHSFASRMAANAARAAALGLGDQPSAEPPPLYSFDPDVGRLAVTTPAYSTAVLPVSRGATGYGGVELARLHDGEQRVAAGIGAVAPGAFGIVVRERSGRVVLASQDPGIEQRRSGRSPLRLTRSPRGPVSGPGRRLSRPHAGAFAQIEAEGAVGAGGALVRVTHRFAAAFVETRWSVTAPSGRSVEATLPTWGRGARIEAVLRDGRRVDAAGGPRLGEVRFFDLQGEEGGYVVVPQDGPADGRVGTRVGRARPTNPRPGPTLVLGLRGAGSARSVSFAVRLAPARAGAADEAAARLGA